MDYKKKYLKYKKKYLELSQKGGMFCPFTFGLDKQSCLTDEINRLDGLIDEETIILKKIKMIKKK